MFVGDRGPKDGSRPMKIDTPLKSEFLSPLDITSCLEERLIRLKFKEPHGDKQKSL